MRKCTILSIHTVFSLNNVHVCVLYCDIQSSLTIMCLRFAIFQKGPQLSDYLLSVFYKVVHTTA